MVLRSHISTELSLTVSALTWYSDVCDKSAAAPNVSPETSEKRRTLRPSGVMILGLRAPSRKPSWPNLTPPQLITKNTHSLVVRFRWIVLAGPRFRGVPHLPETVCLHGKIERVSGIVGLHILRPYRSYEIHSRREEPAVEKSLIYSRDKIHCHAHLCDVSHPSFPDACLHKLGLVIDG